MKPETQAVHTGVTKDATFHSVTTPIYATSTFHFESIGVHGGFDYSRTANPTRAALEQNLAALEGGAGAVATATGMGAVMTVMMLLKAGDHVIAGRDIYGGTYRLFNQILPRLGITFSFVDTRTIDSIRDAVRAETKLMWIETPSNPLLNIADIQAVVALARERDIMTVADNTFLSPVYQQPLSMGVDLVVQSTTKYINGHSDVVGGAVIGRTPELSDRVKALADAIGTTCSPFDAWLVLRGVKTLPQRMAAHQRNAMQIATFLQQHTAVDKVYYTGLPEHPQAGLIARQQTGHGGMLAFDLKCEADRVGEFFAPLQLCALAESLGGVETLIEQPWSMSHATMGEAGLATSGIKRQTVRMSVGLEHIDDLLEDLERGLGAVS